jgi:signal transduction histidine kinase
MNLRRKTRIIVGTMFLGLIVILYFLSENLMLNNDGAASVSVYEQDVAIAYLMLMIVGAGLIFGIVTILLLEKQVLSRLTRLSDGIQRIGTSGDITARVSMPGTDELSILAGTINGLLAAMEQSEGELRGLYNEERALRQTLEAEIKKRIEFTRALVHELKTPVTPVMASSELLLQKLKDEPLYGLAQNINQGANNLNRRIDELLDLARGEVGMLRLNPEPMDPRQLLQRTVDEETPVAMRNGQTLTARLPDSLPVVVADEERFRQIVLNLVNNAVKFTPPGGKIVLKARLESDKLVVEVQDTGVGISKEEQKLLFEPYRSLESEHERLSGLGLGLSLSKKLVELHGGQIWVKSEKGKGSTFGFSIPLVAAGRKEKVGTGNKS